MIEIRPSSERHYENHGWLESKWSFSFDTYYDPRYVSFGPLRVVNEDVVQPGTGFPMHGHRDMEIITFVLEGAIEHQDSLGNRAIIHAGEVQRMTAGTGIRHAESNPSDTTPLRLFQIWVHPAQQGLPPSYEQKAFSQAQREGRLLPVVSGRHEGGALHINQDASFYTAYLDAGQKVVHTLAEGRRVYLQGVSGAVKVNGVLVSGGDAAKITDQGELEIIAAEPSEIILMDLP